MHQSRKIRKKKEMLIRADIENKTSTESQSILLDAVAGYFVAVSGPLRINQEAKQIMHGATKVRLSRLH